MKTRSTAILGTLLGIITLQIGSAVAADTASTPATPPSKASKFSEEEKALQDASKSSASGAVRDASTNGNAAGLNRNKDAGKGAFEGEMRLQAQKPSPKVDKNAKASAPMKPINKMTMEERMELRKEVVKESKP